MHAASYESHALDLSACSLGDGQAVLLSWWLLSTDAAMHLTHLDVCGNPLGLGKNTRDLSISAMYIQLTGASLL